MRRIYLFILVFLPFASWADKYPTVEELLSTPEEKIDLGLAKLVVDHQMYPHIDIKENLQKIENIVGTIKGLPEFGDTQLQRMGSILRYLYTPGPWNSYEPYSYDLSGPAIGGPPENKTISRLMESKQGNCVSMPILTTILAQRLDIEAYLALAPGHVFVRYHDQKDGIINVETTSGTLLSDQRYIRAFDIHPDAIRNGVYLRGLSKKESIAMMLNELGRKHMHEQRYEQALEVADLILKHDQKSVNAMLLKGNVYYMQLQKELAYLEARNLPITRKVRKELDPLYEQNMAWFEKAEKLGWRQPPPDFKEKYLKSIEEFKNQSERHPN